MNTKGKKATIKLNLLRMFFVVRFSEMTVDHFGGESKTNTMLFIEKAARLDARRKDFSEKVTELMTQYTKYLTEISGNIAT